MNKHEKTIDLVDVTAFLAVSCEHLELDSACLYRAVHRVHSPQARPPSPIPTTDTDHSRKSMNDYRRVARQLLLAVGMGAFLAGPVFADSECLATGTSGPHHELYAKQVEQHHKQLHDALKLSPDQEPGWKKLMESVPPKPVTGVAHAEDWSELTAPERAAKMLELSKLHQEHMTEHVAALTTFYDALTVQQRKTFEDFHAGLHGKSRHHAPRPDKAPAKS